MLGIIGEDAARVAAMWSADSLFADSDGGYDRSICQRFFMLRSGSTSSVCVTRYSSLMHCCLFKWVTLGMMKCKK